ncbi:MAG: TadE/TadG family type IV pilus assembly protein [Novosphingobium sp.]|uniref:TadE/TadG family type IV pilus assembly protein n=1 Tax=Novosphingobium sp. TaxID=1874826 RepID=UPI0032BDB936
MRTAKLIARLCSDKAGAAIIELAFAAPILAVLLVGLVDLSGYISASLSVQRAARAGGEYAVMNGYNSNGVAGAVTAASTRRSTYMTAIAASPAPTNWCGCPNATTGIAVQACGTKCTSGLDAGSYVTASASSTYTALFPWPGFSSGASIASASIVRVQ